MYRFTARFLIACWLSMVLSSYAHAVRIMTDLPTGPGKQFDNIALTPDETTIVTTGQFDTAAADRVYSLPIPEDPTTETAVLTQLSTSSFLVNAHDVAFPPVISPDGQTILFTHDGNSSATNTIYTMPITGEGSSSFTGFFGADPNFVSPGDGSRRPIYSGSDVFFLNNNAGFGGGIPAFPTSPTPFDPSPDWDLIYKRDSSGTVTAVTAPGDGDIDAGLFRVTPNGSSIVYAPDNPVKEGKDRGGMRPKLFTIATSGGASTEIPIPAPTHDFTISRQLEVTSDGQTVLFIADYNAVGKKELFSVPITGGTPTRVSDDLPWSGDVSSFAIAPNGTQVAYVAGQNTGANSELFLTPLTGGTGNSIRVSEPAPSNSGAFDVSTSVEGGQIVFSNDSSQIYYLGNLDTDEVRDLYVVDTTEKTGLVPSPYFYVGLSGGDFFDEANWDIDPTGVLGDNPMAGSIDPGVPIRHSLIIDGDTVSSGSPSGGLGREADFQVGGSLELTPGSVLNFPEGADELDFNPGSGLKLTDATITVFEDIILEGNNFLSGGTITSLGDDIEFQDGHESTINGTTFIAADNVLYENSANPLTGAIIESSDRLGLRYEIDLTVIDTQISVRGESSQDTGGPGHGDVEDIFSGAQGGGSTLTLDGASTLLANAIQDGVSLVLGGTSVATLRNDPAPNPNDPPGGVDVVGPDGEIIFMSAGAELILTLGNDNDVRDRIINGLTGLSYLADSSAWNVTNWDGISPLASLQLVGIAGDFDDDGDVDGADFLLWQRGGSPIPLSTSDLNDWEANFGTTSSVSAISTAVPEPGTMLLLLAGLIVSMGGRGREGRVIFRSGSSSFEQIPAAKKT